MLEPFRFDEGDDEDGFTREEVQAVCNRVTDMILHAIVEVLLPLENGEVLIKQICDRIVEEAAKRGN